MGRAARAGERGGRRTLPGMSLLHRLLHRGSESAHASGAVIPLRPGDVPQGLGYDEEHGDFVITYYDAADPRRGSLVFTDGQGRVSARVELGGLNHYGGVTLHAGLAYVCGAGRVQVHETATLRRGVSEPVATVPVRASSTITCFRGGLYVARFRRNGPERMYRYDLAPDGLPVETGSVLTVPPQTQGVAFEEDGTAHFSRSWGRTNPSLLTRVDGADLVRDGGWSAHNGSDARLPPMAEGSVIVDGRLHQLYESGAEPYRRHARAPALMSLVLGPLRPREHLTVHDLTRPETRGTAPGAAP